MRCHADMRRPCTPGLTSCVPKDEDAEGFRLPQRHGTCVHGLAFHWLSASHAIESKSDLAVWLVVLFLGNVRLL
jgi:hypothetical protein